MHMTLKQLTLSVKAQGSAIKRASQVLESVT